MVSRNSVFQTGSNFTIRSGIRRGNRPHLHDVVFLSNTKEGDENFFVGAPGVAG